MGDCFDFNIIYFMQAESKEDEGEVPDRSQEASPDLLDSKESITKSSGALGKSITIEPPTPDEEFLTREQLIVRKLQREIVNKMCPPPLAMMKPLRDK